VYCQKWRIDPIEELSECIRRIHTRNWQSDEGGILRRPR
jgi:hypothetical protein